MSKVRKSFKKKNNRKHSFPSWLLFLLPSLQLDDKHKTLDLSTGSTWRVLRKNLSPTFTSGNLKRMVRPIDKVTDK